MRKHDEFIAALRANREDDATRMVYADWLEQSGELERAELLRLFAKPKMSRADRKRREALAAVTSSEWRRAVSRPLTKRDGQTLPLAAASKQIARADHPAAKRIAKRIKAWIEDFGEDEDEDDPYGQVIVYDGDLVVAKGDLETSASPVAVLGDLVVANQFTDLIESDQSLIAVAGNTRCRSIWQAGDSLFAGDVHCNVLYASSYQHNRTEILGNLVAREAVIEHAHHIVIHGSLATQMRIGSTISVGGTYFDDDGAADLLDPDLLDEDTNLGWSTDRLYKRICAGESILKASVRDRPPAPMAPAKARKRTPRKRNR